MHRHELVNKTVISDGRALDEDVCKICGKSWWRIRQEERYVADKETKKQ